MNPRAGDLADVAASPSRDVRRRFWLLALLPILLLGALVAIMLRSGPADALQGAGAPPVERLTFQRIEVTDAGFVSSVFNDGPDPITIAQVQVDDAYWTFEAEPGPVLEHLERARIRIPYPWVRGETHRIRVVTSSGVTFDQEIPVAVATPQPGPRFLAIFALIGLYVGVIPVAIGLLWYPMVVQLRRAGLDFVLALTVGLLLFLLVDAASEGIETASSLPSSLQGAALFAFAAFGAYLGLEALGRWLQARRGRERASATEGTGWVLSLLVAVGIGLHNLGEGLAIGAAFALGEAALGGLLIIGFTLHNTTEGLAIVAPLAREAASRGNRVPFGRLIRLGLIGGVPTILGAWLGGFVYAQVWALLFLGVGVGAIGQVVGQILRQMAGDQPLGRYLATAPVMLGLFAGFAVMYATGMLIG